MLNFHPITTAPRFFRSARVKVCSMAISASTFLVYHCEEATFPLAAAQSSADSSGGKAESGSDGAISVEGSISVIIFLIVALFLVRWALREKPQPGKRYHQSFALLCAEDSEKRYRYRGDAHDHTGDFSDGPGEQGGND